jgi:hypothetical protein
VTFESLSDKPSRSVLLLALLAATLFSCTTKHEEPPPTPRSFAEHEKTGRLALVILGDYFIPRFGTELVQALRGVDAGQVIVVCARRFETPLARLFEANGISRYQLVAFDRDAPILREWARDIAVAGVSGGKRMLVVSPNKHALSAAESEEIAGVLRSILGGTFEIEVAPFVFEGGNLAFVEALGRTVLVMGRKVLFDNVRYQRQPWARGLSESDLLATVRRTFGVDSVVVVGRATERPAGRLYLEYHIDMGMCVLGGGRAVVSEFAFGPAQRAGLARAILDDRRVIAPFVSYATSADELEALLARRLAIVREEYEEYAHVLDGLGLDVHRSQVTWEHVLSSMSWTNVVQAGSRLIVPLYPDTLAGRTTHVSGARGHLTQEFDPSSLDEEVFSLEGDNAVNFESYKEMGYEMAPAEEYLHYYAGGLHCFVNVLE